MVICRPEKINCTVSILLCDFCRYEKAVIAMAKQSVTLEVLSYHASASLEDAQRLRVSFAFSTIRDHSVIFCLHTFGREC